jgi:hypothetical protein
MRKRIFSLCVIIAFAFNYGLHDNEKGQPGARVAEKQG